MPESLRIPLRTTAMRAMRPPRSPPNRITPPDPQPVLIRLGRAFADFVHGHARRVAVVSEGFREDLAARGIARARVSVVRNWVDGERFSPGTGDGARVRRELALEGKFVVLFAGTM